MIIRDSAKVRINLTVNLPLIYKFNEITNNFELWNALVSDILNEVKDLALQLL